MGLEKRKEKKRKEKKRETIRDDTRKCVEMISNPQNKLMYFTRKRNTSYSI
ncbi:hypothetical protein GCM10009084_17290 [Marinomonas primoryensis]